MNICKEEGIIPTFIYEPGVFFYREVRKSEIYDWGFPSVRPDFETEPFYDEFYVSKTVKEVLSFYKPKKIYYCNYFDDYNNYRQEIAKQVGAEEIEIETEKFCTSFNWI